MAIQQTAGKRYIIARDGEQFVIVDTPKAEIRTTGLVIARCPDERSVSYLTSLLNRNHEYREEREQEDRSHAEERERDLIGDLQ